MEAFYLLVALIGARAYYEYWRERRLREMAKRVGMTYEPSGDSWMDKDVKSSAVLSKGVVNKGCVNILRKDTTIVCDHFYGFMNHYQTLAAIRMPSLDLPTFEFRPARGGGVLARTGTEKLPRQLQTALDVMPNPLLWRRWANG